VNEAMFVLQFVHYKEDLGGLGTSCSLTTADCHGELFPGKQIQRRESQED